MTTAMRASFGRSLFSLAAAAVPSMIGCEIPSVKPKCSLRSQYMRPLRCSASAACGDFPSIGWAALRMACVSRLTSAFSASARGCIEQQHAVDLRVCAPATPVPQSRRVLCDITQEIGSPQTCLTSPVWAPYPPGTRWRNAPAHDWRCRGGPIRAPSAPD